MKAVLSMKKPQKPALRVWIELEEPADKEHGERLAQLATNMLNRLGEGHHPERFWWSEEERRFCFGGPMGYRVLSDWGNWFNLEYLGRDA